MNAPDTNFLRYQRRKTVKDMSEHILNYRLIKNLKSLQTYLEYLENGKEKLYNEWNPHRKLKDCIYLESLGITQDINKLGYKIT